MPPVTVNDASDNEDQNLSNRWTRMATDTTQADLKNPGPIHVNPDRRSSAVKRALSRCVEDLMDTEGKLKSTKNELAATKAALAEAQAQAQAAAASAEFSTAPASSVNAPQFNEPITAPVPAAEEPFPPHPNADAHLPLPTFITREEQLRHSEQMLQTAWDNFAAWQAEAMKEQARLGSEWSKLAAAKSRVKDPNRVLERLMQEMVAGQSRLHMRLKKLEGDNVGKIKEKEAGVDRASKVEASMREMERELDEARREAEEAKGQLEEAIGQAEEIQGHLEETCGQLQETNALLEEARGQLGQARADRDRFRVESAVQSRELANVKMQLEQTEQARELGEDALRRARTAVASWGAGGGFPGVQGHAGFSWFGI